MTISSFLTNLVIPLNLCITLLLIAAVLFMLRWRKTAFFIAASGLGWALFWSLPASSLWAGGRLEQLYPHRPVMALPTAQAIVVLGGSTANGRQRSDAHTSELQSLMRSSYAVFCLNKKNI